MDNGSIFHIRINSYSEPQFDFRGDDIRFWYRIWGDVIVGEHEVIHSPGLTARRLVVKCVGNYCSYQRQGGILQSA